MASSSDTASPLDHISGAGLRKVRNWGLWINLATFLIGYATGEVFLFFAVVCLLALGFVYRYVPETKDRDHEQIDNDLKSRALGGNPEASAA